MKPGSLRGFVLAAALALFAIWLAPALILPAVAGWLGAARGISLEFERVRPALPFGLSAGRAVVTRAGESFELSGIRARIVASGLRVDARVGDGMLLIRTDGLTLRRGLLRAQALPVERLRALAPGAFALRGTADGMYRFGARESLELTLQRGAVVLRAPLAVELEFTQLVVAAEREPDGAWRLNFADLRGPPLSGSARGWIGANGMLALAVEITELEEPARSAFGLAALPTEPIPYRAELTGTLARPLFSAVPAAPE